MSGIVQTTGSTSSLPWKQTPLDMLLQMCGRHMWVLRVTGPREHNHRGAIVCRLAGATDVLPQLASCVQMRGSHRKGDKSRPTVELGKFEGFLLIR